MRPDALTGGAVPNKDDHGQEAREACPQVSRGGQSQVPGKTTPGRQNTGQEDLTRCQAADREAPGSGACAQTGSQSPTGRQALAHPRGQAQGTAPEVEAPDESDEAGTWRKAGQAASQGGARGRRTCRQGATCPQAVRG